MTAIKSVNPNFAFRERNWLPGGFVGQMDPLFGQDLVKDLDQDSVYDLNPIYLQSFGINLGIMSPGINVKSRPVDNGSQSLVLHFPQCIVIRIRVQRSHWKRLRKSFLYLFNHGFMGSFYLEIQPPPLQSMDSWKLDQVRKLVNWLRLLLGHLSSLLRFVLKTPLLNE